MRRLIGPNGAGKSTLLLHLNGLLPESAEAQAAVYVDGLPVEAKNLAEVRRRVGLMFQDPNDQLFCPTVYEDVAFGPQQLGLSQAEVGGRVAESLAAVRLVGFENRGPHHLSQWGEAARVSGGGAGVPAVDPGVG